MAQTAQPRHMQKIHVGLKPATLAKLRRKVTEANRDIAKHVRRLVEIDLGETKEANAK